MLAPALVPWVAVHYSWRAAFLITGFFSLLWIVWWFRYYRRPAFYPRLTKAPSWRTSSRSDAAEAAGPRIPWPRLWGYRQTWAFAIGKF